jgi:Zn-dependent protease with chaperone function
LAEQACPQCGKTITVDSRFVTWCESCNWNIEPPSQETRSPRAQRRQRAAKVKGEALFKELRSSPVGKPSLSGAGIAAFGIALAIHAFTLAIFMAGVFILVTNFPTFFGFVVGGLLIVLGLVIRPRLGGVESGTVILPRESAPALYGLSDRVAGQLGAKPIDLVALTADFNASHGQAGLRRSRVIWIGLPLWNVLTDEERVAIISHELAHQVNGDLSFGLVVGSGLNTLRYWHRTLRPGSWQPGGGDIFSFFETVGQLLARGIYRVLRKLVELLYDLEQSLLFRSRQRAEYYADRVAARVASTPAMLAVLDILHLDRACSLAIRYAAQREEGDIWSRERAFVHDFSPKEWERLRRLDAMRGTAVDSTHPPTNLRFELLKSAPQQPAQVQVSAQESAAIAAEMASGYDLVGEKIIARFGS